MNKRLPHLRGMVCEILGADQILRRNRWTRDWLTLWDSPENAAEPEQLSAACLLVRRGALDEVGDFDEGFYYVLDDADLCYRFRRAGWRFRCVQAACVTHYGGSSFTRWDPTEQQLNYYRCTYYFFRKHSGPVKYFLIRGTLWFSIFFKLFEAALRGTARLAWNSRRLTVGELGQKARRKVALLRSMLGAGSTRRERERAFKS